MHRRLSCLSMGRRLALDAASRRRATIRPGSSLLGRSGCARSTGSFPTGPVVAPKENPQRFMTTSSSSGGSSEPVNEAQASSEQKHNDNVDADEELKKRILTLALEQVHEHGWTDKAVVQALVEAKLPLTLSGVVAHSSDLVEYFMEDCQRRLQEDLEKWKRNNTIDEMPLSTRLYEVLRMRLEYVVPYVKSRQWQHGMALGATHSTSATATQLQNLVNVVADSIVSDDEMLGQLERAGIGSIYVATELHLLASAAPQHGSSSTDEDDLQATWDFLKARADEWEQLRTLTPLSVASSSDAAVAATAVASSLGGAVLSLLQPAAREVVTSVASTVVSNLSTVLQQPAHQADMAGTRPSDYEKKN